jgi:putative transposase
LSDVTSEDQTVRIVAAAAGPCRDPLYRGDRVPAALISHAVWRYVRFALRHRDAEDLLAERGVRVSDEAIRLWCRTLGPTFATALRRRRARARACWHLDEVQRTLTGKRHWRWRAVDRDGLVLDLLAQERRNQEAAERFRRRVLDGAGRAPRVVVTANLASYPPALKRRPPQSEPRRHNGLTNRAEHSHRPVRKPERALQRFTSPEHAQRFLEPCRAGHPPFRPRRPLLPAAQDRQRRTERFQQGQEATRLQPVA